MKHFSIQIFILSIIILFFACSSTLKKEGSINNSAVITKQLDDANYVHFIDYNNIEFFFQVNDTLYCNTYNGVVQYDNANDKWNVCKKAFDISKLAKERANLNCNEFEPNGFPIGGQIYLKHGTWILLNPRTEGRLFEQIIADTINRIYYTFPNESIKDFYVKDSILWIGSQYGLTKLNLKTQTKSNYLVLPAYRKLKSIMFTDSVIFYLDYHYGLFTYNKKTKSVKPIEKISILGLNENVKYVNSFILDSLLFVLTCPMDKNGDFIKGNMIINEFNIKSNEIISVSTNLKYFDTYKLIDNNKILFYGEFAEYYDPTATEFVGGALMYDLENKQAKILTEIPIIDITISGDYINALNINYFDNLDYLTYKNLQIPLLISSSKKVTITKEDVLYTKYDCSNDTIIHIGNEIRKIKCKEFKKYSNIYMNIKGRQEIFPDTTFKTLLFEQSIIKIVEKGFVPRKY